MVFCSNEQAGAKRLDYLEGREILCHDKLFLTITKVIKNA
jgi:hypothetical protein